MSDNKDKNQLEQVRVTGRNNDIVVRQLVEKYNSSEGWAVVRVSSSPLSLDVYLERNVAQGETDKVKDREVITKDVVNIQEEVVDEKDKPTASKKTTASKTTTKK